MVPRIAESIEYSKFAASEPKELPKLVKFGERPYDEPGSKGDVYVVVVKGNMGDAGDAKVSAAVYR